MKLSQDSGQLEELVMRYLYDDLADDERALFEQELANKPELQTLLAQERRLDQWIPHGTTPLINQERLEESSRQVRRGLQQQVANRSVAGQFFVTLLRKPSLVALQTFALGASYVLGFLIASPAEIDNGYVNPLAGTLSPLSLVGEQDYEIADMQIERFDPVSGDIELFFAIASETQLTGNVADSGIRTLMTVALLNEIDAAARLDTIEALQNAVHENDVTASMIRVLATDSNPGVRYSAVRFLVEYVEQESVRDALQRSLEEDVNPGVRVEAFNALARNPDAETLALFDQQAEVDGNEYIRQRARAIVEGDSIMSSDIF